MAVKMKNGKDYLTVVERLDMLLKTIGLNHYSLVTEVTIESGVCIVKATLKIQHDSDLEQIYTGHALGDVGKYKSLEATETHAIGRALASAGWHGGEFASANEMESYQDEKGVEDLKKDDFGTSSTNASEKQKSYIKNLCEKNKVDFSGWDFDNMSMSEASEKIEQLQ